MNFFKLKGSKEKKSKGKVWKISVVTGELNPGPLALANCALATELQQPTTSKTFTLHYTIIFVPWYNQTIQSDSSIRGEYISYLPPCRWISKSSNQNEFLWVSDSLEPWCMFVASLCSVGMGFPIYVLDSLAFGCVNPVPISTKPVPISTTWCNLYYTFK